MKTMITRAFSALALGAGLALAACGPQAAAPANEPAAAPAASEDTAAAPAPKSAPEASAVLSAITSRGKLRVGMTGEQPPFNMVSQTGELLGLEVDLAKALAASLELELELVQKPFGELLPAVESGELDIAMSSITMTPSRNLGVAFVGPYFVSGKALLTKNETLAAVKKGKELNAATVKLTALKGSTSELFVQRAAPEAKLTSVATYHEGVKAVAEGQVDALVADLPQVAVTLLRNPEAGFAGVGDPLSFEPIGIALPAGDAHFVNLVTNYMHLLEGTGILEALRARWFGNSEWVKALPPSTFGKPLDPGAQFNL